MRSRRGNNSWMGRTNPGRPSQALSILSVLNATTAGGKQWKCGVKGYTVRSFSDEEWKQWPIVIKSEGKAFEVDRTIPTTIVLLRVFVVGVNGAIAGE